MEAYDNAKKAIKDNRYVLEQVCSIIVPSLLIRSLLDLRPYMCQATSPSLSPKPPGSVGGGARASAPAAVQLLSASRQPRRTNQQP